MKITKDIKITITCESCGWTHELSFDPEDVWNITRNRLMALCLDVGNTHGIVSPNCDGLRVKQSND